MKLFALAAALLVAAPALAQDAAQAEAMTADQAREESAYALGLQAFLWGYPLRYYGETVPQTVGVGGSYVNDFRKFDALKTAADRFVVTPNNVTIDAYATIDLRAEPVVIAVPPIDAGRWYIVQIGDFFDEVARNVGGTAGQQPGTYVVTGPDFTGQVPGGMIEVPVRTRLAVGAVRILANGEADLPAAVAAQDGFRLMPLSTYLRDGLGAKAPDPRPTLPPYESEAPEDIRWFDELGHWMQVFLPTSEDAANELVASFAQIGLSVGKGFEWPSLDEPTRRGLARAVQTGEAIVDAKWAATGETVDGWKYTMAGGRAGYDPGLRAALAKNEVGAQLSDQVLYPNTTVDAAGAPLDGAQRYVLHFPPGALPPVSVFWNLAMYGSDMLFVENDFGRFSIGSTTDGLKPDPDGGLTILIQHDRPEDTANWLPAPAGPFNLTMRLYGPETPVLDGSWRLPGIERLD